MTERLYYQNSFLYDFTASVEAVRALPDGRSALVLNRSAFYPASGGQRYDTGWIEFVSPEDAPLPLPKLRVSEVIEDESDGTILHVVEQLVEPISGSLRLRGFIDVDRRQDHMQQHSGQHVLSAAFLKLFNAPTVSFHMGEESCTIDLDMTPRSPLATRAGRAPRQPARLGRPTGSDARGYARAGAQDRGPQDSRSRA